eukprot:gene11073-3779_t
MKSCLELWKAYLEGFNSHDIESIKRYNDINLETYFKEDLMRKNLKETLPDYLADFKMNEQAKIVKEPTEIIGETESHIFVSLLATAKKKM